MIHASTVTAVLDVSHPPLHVYSFLARLENHWRLGGRRLRVAELDRDGRGGQIVIAGPFGLRRTARTTLTVTRRPHHLGGVAHVGPRTSARVQWTIEPVPDGARVALQSTIHRIGLADRALLALGGRWWLRRAFRHTLAALAAALDGQRLPSRSWTDAVFVLPPEGASASETLSAPLC
jgi:hypothetical protein